MAGKQKKWQRATRGRGFEKGGKGELEMLRSFMARNFRCFPRVSLDPLQRFNLIAGRNNVGKTSLLEGISLHNGPTNPASRYFFDFLRFVERFRIDNEESWEWLFFNKDRNLRAELEGAGADQSNRRLWIKMTEPDVYRMNPPCPKGPCLTSRGSTSCSFIIRKKKQAEKEAPLMLLFLL
jgi:hypothetical protein